MSNLDLWNNVEKTDPRYTKKVTFGRGFTAIDPYYQIKCATEQFGAAGEGWGWEVVRVVEFNEISSIGLLIRLWHSKKDNYIEQWGQSGMYTDNAKSKPDHDMLKKATTDGITKCLSYLGFNADVFTGKFDDNKYVQQMNAEFAKGREKPSSERIADAVKWFKKKIDEDDLDNGAEMEKASQRLSKAEWQKIRGLLDTKAPGATKLYRTLLDDHLKHARDVEMGLIPDREIEDTPTGDSG